VTYYSKSASTVTDYNWTSKKTKNGGSPTYTNRTAVGARLSSFSGSGIRGYAQLKARGFFFAHTAFNKEILNWTISPTTMRRKTASMDEIDENYSQIGISYKTQMTSHASSADTSGANALIQSAAAGLVDEFDVLTNLAEAPETIRMVNRAAKRVAAFASPRLRGRAVASRRDPRELSRLWLEGRYGWAPAIGAVQDLHKALQKTSNQFRDLSKTRSMDGGSSQIIRSATQDWAAGTMSFNASVVTSHSVRGCVAARIRTQAFSFDPIMTAWELVPYSFVVDWVLSVGDAISTARLIRRATASTASIGVETSTTVTATCKLINPKPGYTIVSFDENGYAERYNYSRSPTSILVTPAFKNKPLSNIHAVDLLALASVRKEWRLLSRLRSS